MESFGAGFARRPDKFARTIASLIPTSTAAATTSTPDDDKVTLSSLRSELRSRLGMVQNVVNNVAKLSKPNTSTNSRPSFYNNHSNSDNDSQSRGVKRHIDVCFHCGGSWHPLSGCPTPRNCTFCHQGEHRIQDCPRRKVLQPQSNATTTSTTEQSTTEQKNASQ